MVVAVPLIGLRQRFWCCLFFVWPTEPCFLSQSPHLEGTSRCAGHLFVYPHFVVSCLLLFSCCMRAQFFIVAFLGDLFLVFLYGLNKRKIWWVFCMMGMMT